MWTDILIFLAGFILGAAVLWTYGFVTGKIALAKTGFSLRRAIVMFIINKFKKSKNDNQRTTSIQK